MIAQDSFKMYFQPMKSSESSQIIGTFMTFTNKQNQNWNKDVCTLKKHIPLEWKLTFKWT